MTQAFSDGSNASGGLSGSMKAPVDLPANIRVGGVYRNPKHNTLWECHTATLEILRTRECILCGQAYDTPDPGYGSSWPFGGDLDWVERVARKDQVVAGNPAFVRILVRAETAAPVDTRFPHTCPVCAQPHSAYLGATPASLECRNGCAYGRPYGKA